MLELSSSCKACTIRNWVNEWWGFLIAISISQEVGIWLVVILLLILKKKESETNLQEITVITT